MSKKIKLVLSGSGNLYPCFVGSVLRLAEAGYEFEELCGVSGGSLICAALAAGYQPNKELVKIIKATLPAKNKLIKFSLWTLFKKWGLINADKIEDVLAKYLPKTLGEVKIPLHIVTVNIDRREHRVFNSATDPDMSLARAIRASMSIPGVFTPVMIDGERYVDGGIAANYFLDIFGTGENVIGLRFHSSAGTLRPVKTAKDYIIATIDTMLESNMREHIEDAVFARTILLDSKHSGMNFNISDKECDDMIREGWNCVDKWLKTHDPA